MRTSGGRRKGTSPEGPTEGSTSREHHSQDSADASHRNGVPRPAVPQGALLQALDEYRAGLKDLKEAAAEAGVPSWDLLEAAQATPDPMVGGLDEPKGLQPFVRRRDD